MTKTLYPPIGLNGAGKTHSIKLVERELDVPFLRMPPIWVALELGQDGWKEVEKCIDDCSWRRMK
jgi:hypothetical protein